MFFGEVYIYIGGSEVLVHSVLFLFACLEIPVWTSCCKSHGYCRIGGGAKDMLDPEDVRVPPLWL